MVRLVLKGSNKTFDSLYTDYKVEDHSFTILANTFKTRTSQEWNKNIFCHLDSSRTQNVSLNAGALFADDSPLWQSRLYCTRWDGRVKGDAINDAEFTGNVLMLLREGMNFVKSNTKRGWEKLPNGRKKINQSMRNAQFLKRWLTILSTETILLWGVRFILIFMMTALL